MVPWYGRVADERLQHVLGGLRVEAGGRLVEHQQIGAAAEREQQRQLGAHAAREGLHALGRAASSNRREILASSSGRQAG